jgi:diguanylate cyclase (GGDEF)-like protein
MDGNDSAGALERDALRLAARALGELATGPTRPRHELLAELLAALCARLGANSGVAAERAPRSASGPLRVLVACGDAAEHWTRGDDLPRETPVLARALATLAPAWEAAIGERAALLALPLRACGEVLGALLLEKRTGALAGREAEALAGFAAACGDLLLGYERASLRARAEADLVRSQRHLLRSATLDGLTGLPNRAASQHALDDAALRAHAAGLPLALVTVDVDHAKALAEKLGPAAFDEAIAHTARLLHDTLRPADWSGRWGIDTFVATLLGCDAEAAALVAERIRLRIEGASFALRGAEEIALTVSAGVASTGLAREDGAQLSERALGALEEAKRAGRNRVCVSRPARA